MSMDNSGKIIWAKHSEIQQANLKILGGDSINLLFTLKSLFLLKIWKLKMVRSCPWLLKTWVAVKCFHMQLCIVLMEG